jgi:hypothetical protein
MDRRVFLKSSVAFPIGLAFTKKAWAGVPLLETLPAPKPNLYVGVWRAGQGGGAQWSNPAADWDTFAAKDKSYFDQGLRIVTMSSYYDFNQNMSKYTATWRAGVGGGAQWTVPATDWNTFAQKTTEHFNQGLRLVAVSITNRKGQIAYAGTSRAGMGTGTQWVTQAKEWNEFSAQAQTYFGQGLRLVSLSTTYNVQGKTVYSGVWRGGVGTGAQWTIPATDWASFEAKDKGYFDNGLRLVAVSTYVKSGTPLYTGVWRAGVGAGAPWVNTATDWDTFAAKDKTYYDQGLRLVALSLARDQSTPID